MLRIEKRYPIKTAIAVVGILVLSISQVVAQKYETKVNDVDKSVMILIPEGPFKMGNNSGGKKDKPEHTINLSKYWIYKHEVTVAQYMAFAKPSGRKLPSEPPYGFHDDYPVVYVNWKDADAYCRWAGGMLPTEAQWEKAARGTDGRLYPWGNRFVKTNARASAGVKEPKPVGSFPQGASPYGVLDMSGNVAEWVNDHFQSDYYKISPDTNPKGPDRGKKGVRGGAFNIGNQKRVTTTSRASTTQSTYSNTTGFRCASSN